MRAKPLRLIITCEHGGNRLPKDFAGLFHKQDALLDSHRAYDEGALELARQLAHRLGAPLFFSRVTRLLVDLNRSPHNPARFSEITRRLGKDDRTAIERLYYEPYRNNVQSAFRKCIEEGGRAVHVSVHTFTPVLRGKMRHADIGFLYDPSRKREAAFCVSWQQTLRELQPELRIRRNYPYRGKSDGFTAHLRGLFPEYSYLGIELEVNQKIPGYQSRWPKLKKSLIHSLIATTRENIFLP